MSADNVVLLFILVWTFMAVCQADDDIRVSCDDVTGSVGKEVNLTCSISLLNTECCIVLYKFHKSVNHSAICQEFPVNPCEQRKYLTCRYTPTTAVTEKIRFFVQTKCIMKSTEFSVDITEPMKYETDEAPGKKGIGTETFVVIGISCFIIIIIIIIIVMAVICVKRFKSTNPSGLQKNNERGVSEEQTMMTTNV